MLPTQKKKRKVTLDGLILYLYGPPMVGKTTFAANLETKNGQVLFLDCEGGTERLEQETYAQPVDSWQTFKDSVDALHKEEHTFNVVVVDPLTDLRDLCVRHVCNLRGARDENDPKFGGFRGWGLVSSEWKTALVKLMAGPWATVLLDHAKQISVDHKGNEIGNLDSYKGQVFTMQIPTLSKSARFIIAKRADVIMRAYKDANGRRVATISDLDGMGGQRGSVLPDSFELDGKQFLEYFRAAYKAAEIPSAKG